MSPRKKTTCPGNISLRILSNNKVCELLHHLAETTHFLFHVHQKIIQFRPEKVLYHCTIPIRGDRYSNIVLFEKVQTPHTKLKNGTPHSNLRAVEWPLVKFPRVTVTPVPEILFVDCAWKVEMCLVCASANHHFEWTPRQQRSGAHPTKPVWIENGMDTAV
jgi:hypothetical protein